MVASKKGRKCNPTKKPQFFGKYFVCVFVRFLNLRRNTHQDKKGNVCDNNNTSNFANAVHVAEK